MSAFQDRVDPVAEGLSSPGAATGRGGMLIYLLLGTIFGILLIKAEVVSWFRIQEMFRFQSFHMFGILGSAVAVAALSLALIRKTGARTMAGQGVEVAPKELDRGARYAYGGILFGIGWAFTGACPGPVLALLGYGVGPIVYVLISIFLGTLAYGHLRPHLPH